MWWPNNPSLDDILLRLPCENSKLLFSGAIIGIIVFTGYIFHQVSGFIFSLHANGCPSACPYVQALQKACKGRHFDGLKSEDVEGALGVDQTKNCKELVEWIRRKWSIALNNNDIVVVSGILLVATLIYSGSSRMLPMVILLIVGVIHFFEARRIKKIIFSAHASYFKSLDNKNIVFDDHILVIKRNIEEASQLHSAHLKEKTGSRTKT